MQDAFSILVARIQGLPELLFSNQSRSYWGYLLLTGGIAFMVYLANNRDGDRSFTSFLRYLFPKRVYAHHSFRLDLKLVLFMHLAVPAGWFLEGWLLAVLADGVAGGLRSVWSAAPENGSPSTALKLLLGVLLFVASDFARFFCHWVHHRIPALWELHSVHHSAEHLNPLTTYRFHPIEMMFENLSVVIFVGTLAGLFGAAVGGSPLTWYGTIYAWAYLRAANALGTNLRHMHVWWAWNPSFSHVFSSPAQHQIHHSTNPKHYDKNFGFFLSIWDWMFGTLYVPREKETLEFGLTNGVTHKTLRGALINPFVRMLRGERDEPPASKIAA